MYLRVTYLHIYIETCGELDLKTISSGWLVHSPHLYYVCLKPTNNNEARYPNGQFNGLDKVLDTPEQLSDRRNAHLALSATCPNKYRTTELETGLVSTR